MNLDFEEIWCIDYEFSAPPGEVQKPICLVAHEFRSGRRYRIWEDKLGTMGAPPYSVGANSLFVAYYAPAELGCHLALGWALPANVLDLYAEFRNVANGLSVPCGYGLLGALAYYGLDGIESSEKDAMRDLAIRGGPWTNIEREALLNYCEGDVVSLEKLLVKMHPSIHTLHALLRGRYMKAVAHIEHCGVPIDMKRLALLRKHGSGIWPGLIDEIDADFGIYDGSSFRMRRFEKYLADRGLSWPRLPSGALALDDSTFRDMARTDPDIAAIRQLRAGRSQVREIKLAVGSDGRNRCLISPFKAKTGRNQPSSSKFIFGLPAWLRGLIRPELGRGLAYIDWSQQEFGIAAALSGDTAMQGAYLSGDPYLSFAKQAGSVPQNATARSHRRQREQFKACVLAVQYGMGARSLAQRIGRPKIEARELLRMHRQAYPDFWRWSRGAVDYAMLQGRLPTVFGWQVQVGLSVNPRSLRNFPMQANGAEMLRLACCLATESGIRVCAPVHDALLIEAPISELDRTVQRTQELMAQASMIVLSGFELRTEVESFQYPDRYQDHRGLEMWETVWKIVEELEARKCA